MININKAKLLKANLIPSTKSLVFTDWGVPLLIFFIFFTAYALPAECANPSSGEESGPQISRFKSESEVKEKQLRKKDIKRPQIEIPKAEKRSVPSKALSFLLKDIYVSGATVFKPEEFRSLYQAYLGREVSFNDLEAIAEKIKGKYAQNGFVTSMAYIPPQDIMSGRIEIKVIEGKVGKIKVEGNRWFSASLIERLFHTKKMKS